MFYQYPALSPIIPGFSYVIEEYKFHQVHFSRLLQVKATSAVKDHPVLNTSIRPKDDQAKSNPVIIE